MNTVLLQPLPYADSDRLVRVVEHGPESPRTPCDGARYPLPEFLDWKSARTLADTFAVTGIGQQLVRTSHGVVGLWGAATTNAFRVLGVTAVSADRSATIDSTNADVVVLAHSTWQRHFNGDANVVGSTLELGAGAVQAQAPPRLLTVVGVLPADFQLPMGHADFYFPLFRRVLGPATGRHHDWPPGCWRVDRRGDRRSECAGIRDSPGVARRRAGTGGAAIRTAAAEGPGRGRSEARARILLAAVIVVLLIVCANVATLLSREAWHDNGSWPFGFRSARLAGESFVRP